MEENKNKITLEQFWDSKEKMAIHTSTQEEFDTLCKAFDKMGKTWRTDERYVENNPKHGYYYNNVWQRRREETCLDNNRSWGPKKYYLESDYHVYEFEDVDMGKYAENDEESEI